VALKMRSSKPRKAKRASWWNDAAHVDSTGPLEAGAAPGWEPCLTSLAKLQRCELPDMQQLAQLPPATADVTVERYTELGGSVLGLLQRTFELQHAVGRACGTGAPDVSMRLADLLPSHTLGKELEWMPLYKHVMASQQVACRRFLEAMSEEADETWGQEADASMGELEDGGGGGESSGQPGRRGRASGAEGFRDLYMEILTEGASSELDSLRRDETLSATSLSMLIDALQFGAATFTTEEQELAADSYQGAGSWWARSQPGDAAEGTADARGVGGRAAKPQAGARREGSQGGLASGAGGARAPAAGAGEASEEGAEPPLVGKARALMLEMSASR